MILDVHTEEYVEKIKLEVITDAEVYPCICGWELADAMWNLKTEDCRDLLVYIIFHHPDGEFLGGIIKALEEETDCCADNVDVSKIGAYLRKALSKQDRLLLQELI